MENAQYLINIETGRIVFRNPETDRQVNLWPISNDVAAGIRDGKITAAEVISAIDKRREKSEESFLEYNNRLMELNVRRSNPQKEPVREQLADRSDKEISLDDFGTAKGKEKETAPKGKLKGAVKIDDLLS